MGTRADFYVGRGTGAEWLGSVAMDGYPEGVPDTLRCAVTERIYRDQVAKFLADTDHATVPSDGWPWPWDDSRTTDYAYAFDGGAVWASCFGHRWFDASEEQPYDETPKEAVFPDMSAKMSVTYGKRSGLFILGR